MLQNVIKEMGHAGLGFSGLPFQDGIGYTAGPTGGVSLTPGNRNRGPQMRKPIESYFSDFTRIIYRGWRIVLPLWILVTCLVNEEALEDLETVKARALASFFYPHYMLSSDFIS
jgi:hypothetical protein